MKKVIGVLSTMMVLGLLMAAIGWAGTDTTTNPPTTVEKAQDPMTVETVELTGSVLNDNIFVDENGESYQLETTDATAPLLNMVGEKIKLSATVLGQEGPVKSLLVSSYKIVDQHVK